MPNENKIRGYFYFDSFDLNGKHGSRRWFKRIGLFEGYESDAPLHLTSVDADTFFNMQRIEGEILFNPNKTIMEEKNKGGCLYIVERAASLSILILLIIYFTWIANAKNKNQPASITKGQILLP